MNRLTYRLKDQYGNPTDKIIVETDYTYMSTPKKQEVVLSRLAAIEDILGDEYDLDELKEMVQAKRKGRCVVLPIGGYSDKDGEKALKNAMFVCSLTNNAVNRYTADAIAEKLTREEAEAALRRDQE